MISLKKRQAEGRLYNWRPDFRDHEALPDVRAVRTKFIVPTLLITAAIIFSSIVVFRELKAMRIQEDIAQIQASIDADDAKHSEIVERNSEFRAITQNLEEIAEFESGYLVASDFLLAISSRLLEDMHLTMVDYGPSLAVIEGNIKVSAEEASRIVDEYLKIIEKADVLQGLLTDYKLTSLERTVSEDTVKFRIEVSPKKDEGKKKK